MPNVETIEPSAKSAPAARPSAPVPRKKNRLILWLAALALVAAAVWWGARYAHHALNYETTEDAYLHSHIHQVSASVGGIVKEVLVDENATVHAGQVLVKLDVTEFEIAVEKAKAALAQARATELEEQAALSRAQAQATQSLAQIKQAEAQVTQAGAERETASLNLGRAEKLYSADGHSISKAEVDTARGSAEGTHAAVDAARANVDAARALAQASQSAIEAARARLEAAKASISAQTATLRDAERELSYTEVKAPSDGQIGNKNVEAGDRIQLGQPLFAMVEPHGWVIANFKETQLKRMQLGQSVEITVDAIADRHFQGTIESFAPATGAQFALLPPDNASGNFTKVVQRVPVKIAFDPASVQGLEDRLHAGLSAVVSVRVK